MVIVNKSNWTKRGLFLVVTLLLMGFTNYPKATTSAVEEFRTTLTPVASEQIQIVQTKLPVVLEKPVTAAHVSFRTSGLALKIDAINLNIPLGKTGLDRNRNLMVPANPNTAAWYRSGPQPGNAGTALITGHLDSAAGPGVFWNLKKLSVGDKISVQRDDGKTATFQINKLASYAQDNSFPWGQVYSTGGASGLRIITCDGTYNPRTGHYSRNLVVYASLVSIT
ncbi:MAG: class F sortase [Candidatus Doudnabacteria bacterium]|nr:class F sortase [Candidatus Doudnabacteria bacterium]